MEFLKKIKFIFDKVIESFALLLLTAMVVIICMQVFTRYFFSYTPSWSEAISLLFMVWMAFIGIAVGIRENLHISIEFVFKKFPYLLQRSIDVIIKLLVLVVGILFIYQGIKFTTIMHTSTLAGTKFPTSTLYAVVPLTGFLMVVYGIESFFKKNDHHSISNSEEE